MADNTTGAVEPEVAIVGYAVSPMVSFAEQTEVQLCLATVTEALAAAHLTRQEIDFTCSGSSDYLSGGTFTFVANLDAVGAWPPIKESHVEMDGAWALHEAWIRLRIAPHTGADPEQTALVFGSGKSSTGELDIVLALQGDPYYLAPLGADPHTFAALQARALIEAGRATERDLAEVAARSRRAGVGSPHAVVSGTETADDLLATPYVRDPLRASDLPPVTDGACAVVLATRPVALRLAAEHGIVPVWIRAIEHRVEPHQPGMRDLTTSTSTRLAGEAAGVGDGPVDVAELSATYSHQELILTEALGLDPAAVRINPSGGALAANPVMATGLVRIAEAARAARERAATRESGAVRAVAHATSGPCLQQNLVCLLETTTTGGAL
ncbi:acetyl-CoA acetyltransferase [Parafrankia sp. EUN1f]|uniref:acetyl-CoA acetyltransferase n=1 Tax=Parafrankia sp. EUN1f TaxID=102897 RepID=UPI0001C45157|nr:acetyl-CoA acetyltransferase [Parafrankia sp. EUN1f]EFC84654.1 Acetyl-CoA acetyltransferase-like protein [Parafrankia sp. EUN1f]